MVYKRSEYGHQFKVSSLVKNVPVYKEHLSYRHFRRERECAHTPLSWDGEIIESSESDDKLDDDDVHLPISELVINEEDETGNDKTSQDERDDASDDDDDEVVKQKKEAQKKAAESKQVDDETCEIVVTKQSEELRKSAKQKLNNYVNSKNKKEALPSKDGCDKKVFGKTFAKPTPANDKLFVKSSKPRRPDRQGRVPKARPQSAPMSRQLAQGVDNSQPFINYGSGSSNRNLGDMKTFNIKAACAVYPAALRAKKRNLLLIEKQKERARTASAREKRRKAKFNDQIARETALWDTEYRRSYPCYENTEYSTSERDPRKQKSYFLN